MVLFVNHSFFHFLVVLLKTVKVQGGKLNENDEKQKGCEPAVGHGACCDRRR